MIYYLTLKERSQLGECGVGHIIEPALDEYAVIGLQLEVLRNVVHDYGPREVAPDATQVLHEDRPIRQRMLAVHTIANVLLLVYLIKHPIRILNFIL